MLLTASVGWCVESIPVLNVSSVMKALPIYSNELIDQAPAGEVITGVRDCYSSYFQGGS